jgi:hypothetical protein
VASLSRCGKPEAAHGDRGVRLMLWHRSLSGPAAETTSGNSEQAATAVRNAQEASGEGASPDLGDSAALALEPSETVAHVRGAMLARWRPPGR